MPRVTACATLGYAACDLETALDAIAARGFTRVEITELGAYCRHFPFQKITAKAAAKLLDRRGLKAVAMNVSFCRLVNGELFRPQLSDPRTAEGVLVYARWYLEQARALGIGTVSFPIGPRVPDAGWERSIQGACAAYRRIAEEAAARGINLNLETPHLFQLTDSVAHVRAIFETIQHPAVGATVDSSHWGIIRYDLDAFFAWLGPRLRHVHLRDSAGRDTNDFGQKLELTPGQGSVDFATFGAALDRAGYAGEVTLELEHRYADLPRIGREFEAGIRHLRQCGWTFPFAS